MDTSKFIDAVRNHDTSVLPSSDKGLAEHLLAALGQASREFHADVLQLLENVRAENDLTELIGTICSISSSQRTQLFAFVTTGEATEAFSSELNADIRLQRAVEIAFVAHIGQLPDFEQALDAAKEYLDHPNDEEAD